MYQAPELQLIGSVSEVVMGVPAFGGDAIGDLDWVELEFERD